MATRSFVLAGHESRGWCVFISDVGIFSIYLSPTLGPAAGPVSLEDYFQKVAPLGQKPELNLWNVDTMSNSKKKNFSRAFAGLSNLAYKILQKKYVKLNFLFT